MRVVPNSPKVLLQAADVTCQNIRSLRRVEAWLKFSIIMGTCKVQNEIETKRNQSKRNETYRNETKIETKLQNQIFTFHENGHSIYLY
jgi:hypothetical protein